MQNVNCPRSIPFDSRNLVLHVVMEGLRRASFVHSGLGWRTSGSNVVLDLNGILCVCEDWKSKGLSHKKLRDFSQPHSATEPTLVGTQGCVGAASLL